MSAEKCGVDIPWYGLCREPKANCKYHSGLKCWKCKRPATATCGVSGSLTCGTPECADHSHAGTHYGG